MDAIYEQTKTFEKVSSLSIFSVILTDHIGSPDRGERESSQRQQRLLRLQVLSDCSPQPGGVQAALSDQQTHGDCPLVSSLLTTTASASHTLLLLTRDGKMNHNLEMPDLSGGWETMGMSGIWQTKGNSEEYKKDLEKVKEELVQERKQKAELAKEISDLKEELNVEIRSKKELDETIETLKKESVASALKERTSWEKQIKVTNIFIIKN